MSSSRSRSFRGRSEMRYWRRSGADAGTAHRETGGHGGLDQPQSHRDTEVGLYKALTSQIIGAAIEVHRALGPGLLEPLYEKALCIELEEQAIPYERQVRVPAFYKGRLLGEYRVDLIVEDKVVVEIKSVSD